MKNLDRLYICVVVRLVGRLQRWADTNVTLAFEDAQVIPPFSREETDDTDTTDDTDDTYYTYYTDDTDDTNDTDDTIDTTDTDDTDDTDDTGWNRLE